MRRLKEIIYNKELSTDLKYESFLCLMKKLDGQFELEVDGNFVYKPYKIENTIRSGLVTVHHNHSYSGDFLVDKITRNMQDEEVGIVISRRLNYIPNELAKKVFYERIILKRDVRFIKRKYRLGSASYYSLLQDAKDVLIEYMCLNITEDTLDTIESYKKKICV